MLGVTIFPVATSTLAIKRMSCHAADIQIPAARRDRAAWASRSADARVAWIPVISSVLITCVPCSASIGVAS